MAKRVRPSQVGKARTSAGGPSNRIVGFGVILSRGTDAGTMAGVFGFAVIVFGSLIGAGFAMSSLGRR